MEELESDHESEVQSLELLNSVLESDNKSACGSYATVSDKCLPNPAQTTKSGSPDQSKIEISLALNKLIDDKLKKLEGILCNRLAECRKKLTEVQTKCIVNLGKRKFKYLHCGFPYFKDAEWFPAPENHDVVLMKQSELFNTSTINAIIGWTVKDKSSFLHMIEAESRQIKKTEMGLKLSKLKNKLSKSATANKKAEIEKAINETMEDLNKLPTAKLAEIAQPITYEYSWHKIALKFNYRHSAKEFRAMWKLFLHPSINKNPWSDTETDELKKLIIKYRYQDWDRIASELKSDRTGYQCFVYYRTNMLHEKTGKKWSVEEEEYLIRLIDYYRQDNYIPWTKISSKMPQRTKLQIYNKFLRMRPKKGRFVNEEDAVIMTCARKYGPDFKKMASFLVGRSVDQVRLRYRSLMRTKNSMSMVWTLKEDKKLIQLMANQESFASIAKNLPGKDRTTIRTRYITLQNWMSKNPGKDIRFAPRRAARNLSHGKAANDLNSALINLKDRMKMNYHAIKPRNEESQCEKSIDDSIMIALTNEELNLPENEELICDQATNEWVPKGNLIKTNTKKLLLLLNTALNKEKYSNAQAIVAEYGMFDSDTANVTIVKHKSYSKKKPASSPVALDDSVWSRRNEDKEIILSPHLATILGCKLLMNCVNAHNTHKFQVGKMKINTLKKKKLFKDNWELLAQRFRFLFTWPMLMSNYHPSEKIISGEAQTNTEQSDLSDSE